MSNSVRIKKWHDGPSRGDKYVAKKHLGYTKVAVLTEFHQAIYIGHGIIYFKKNGNR